MGFEKYVAKTEKKTAAPTVTLRPSGLISFDRSAVEQFDLAKASHAAVYFDRARKIIGVRPLDSAEDEGSFVLTKRRNTVALKPSGFFEDARLIVDRVGPGPYGPGPPTPPYVRFRIRRFDAGQTGAASARRALCAWRRLKRPS